MRKNKRATVEPPRVSLIILSYNQEQFIDDAVLGALAQNYPNLEIVMSDDNSTDTTFNKLRDHAENYKGRHKLLVNQEPGGRGILAHLYAAVALSSGELIVVGAGDDVSYPTRVSTLVERWQAAGAVALSSGFDRVDQYGKLLERVPIHSAGEYDPAVYFFHRAFIHISGASAAYDRRVFDAVRLPAEAIMGEDYFFSLVMGLRSRLVERLSEPLIAYRSHQGSISHFGWAGIEHLEKGTAYQAGMVNASLRLFRQMAVDTEGIDPSWGAPAEVDYVRLANDIAFSEYRANWLSSSFTERAQALFHFREPKQLHWMVPRLFGVTVLSLYRRIRFRMNLIASSLSDFVRPILPRVRTPRREKD